jgi:N-methylhydantoinase A/oxoprolinase/acetone carboxylase beta subunit
VTGPSRVGPSRVGVDVGGTFTDVVTESGRVGKVLSSMLDPAGAVAAGLRAAAIEPGLLAHGTTVATNALLERSGGRVALVTNQGMADIIEIGRQNRPSLYDQWADRSAPLVPRDLRLEVGGRLDETGAELEPLGPPPPLPAGVEAVAICLLHADLNDAHERWLGSAYESAGVDVCRSSEVAPEFREYERCSTAVVNAYVRPRCRTYLRRLAPLADEVLVMTSAGGLVPMHEAAERPVALLVSGPAAGVQAAAAAALAAGFPDAITLDMGGTSTDVCLLRGGRPEPATMHHVAGFPVRVPGLDVHSIGAGGGSIAWLDPGGSLAVGPRSAGAEPGPACYGRGGTEPTVTDANLVAGRLPSDLELSGIGTLDVAAARRALVAAKLEAGWVIEVVEAQIAQALRRVSVERGVDPRDLALVAFGGAGPLHAAPLARALGMRAVVVPPRAGVLSAVGLLGAPRQVDLVRSWPTPGSTSGLAAAREELADLARAQLAATTGAWGEVAVTSSLDCRYAGQSHELVVAELSDFEEEHRRRNGFTRPGAQVEVVALRARGSAAAPLDPSSLPPPPRRRGEGPCVLAEADTTLWVPPGFVAEVGGGGSWVITGRGPG